MNTNRKLNKYAFDPSKAAFDQEGDRFYESAGLDTDGQLTIVVKLIDQGIGLPSKDINRKFQLFAPLYGIHTSANEAEFPEIEPIGQQSQLDVLAQLSRKFSVLLGIANQTITIDQSIVAGNAVINLFTGSAAGGGASIDSYDFTTPNFAFNGQNITGPSLMYPTLIDKNKYVTYFTPKGDLRIGQIEVIPNDGTDAKADGGYTTRFRGVEITCREVSYKDLLESLKTTQMMIRQTKVTYNSPNTLNMSHKMVGRTFFGSNNDNRTVLVNSLDIYQQQVNAVIWNDRLLINQERGINAELSTGETELTYLFKVSKYDKNGVGFSS